MKPLQIVAITLGVAMSGMLIFFIAGEMLSDPGGIQGVLLVLAWLALPVGLALLAWLRPVAAYPVLVVMVGLVLLAAAVGIPMAHQWWAFENTHGPIDLMVYLGAFVPLIALGRAMPVRAGWMMLITMGGALVLHSISLLIVGQPSGILVFAVLAVPLLVSAVLFVVVGRQDTQPRPTVSPA